MGMTRKVESLPGYAMLAPLMDEQSTRPLDARMLARTRIGSGGSKLAVLDLGCGEGATHDWFNALDPSIEWHGVDIEDSPEVRARPGHDPRIVSYDGVNIPFEDGCFDVVFSEQVFEHVQQPYPLMRDVARVLKPGGLFIGSVAYLEPYHSFSTFNFTPYGMLIVLRDAGLDCLQLRHSSDFLYKSFRQMLGGSARFSALQHVSPLYGLIDIVGTLTRLSARNVNLLKLQYAGNFAVLATKPVRQDPATLSEPG